MIFFLMLFLASFVLQAQDLNVTHNIKLQDVDGSVRGNIYLGGKTYLEDNGMRLFGGGNYAGFIDVVSNSGTDGLRFRVDQNNGSAERMRITADGKIGINNSSPLQALDVRGKIRTSNKGNASEEYVEIYHGGSHGFINTAGDGNLDFRHDNVTQMSLTDGGNLGIGTSTPVSTLHVTELNPAITITGDEGGTLQLGSADCIGCYSPFSQIGDGVMRMLGSSNIIFSTSSISNYGRTFKFATDQDILMEIKDDGKISIGNVTTPGQYKLYVEEGILAEKVKVATDGLIDWADYVFEENYDLNSTKEVETFIKENKHLPNVPSAKEVNEKGVDMVEMDATLLRQIEELWLHVIELKKQNEALNNQIKALK